MNVLLLPESAFFICDDGGQGARISDGAQISHVRQVLGAQVGDVLKIGKIGGALGTAKISVLPDVGTDSATSVIALSDVCLTKAPPPKLPLTLVLALPRPKVLRRLMMDMTALGVAQIVIVNSYRSDKSYWQSPLLAAVDDFMLAGLQQGVDTQLPKLSFAKRFKPFVEDELPALGKRIAVAHPYAERTFYDYQNTHGLPDVLLIGAEGGWIDYEVALLESVGATALSLGARIMRTEAVVNALLGRWLA